MAIVLVCVFVYTVNVFVDCHSICSQKQIYSTGIFENHHTVLYRWNNCTEYAYSTFGDK